MEFTTIAAVDLDDADARRLAVLLGRAYTDERHIRGYSEDERAARAADIERVHGSPPNPAELLSRGSLVDMLANLGESYDVILLDTPPASDSADFQTVAARAKGAVVTVRKNHTRLNDVAGVKAMLGAAGAEVVGAVVNEH